MKHNTSIEALETRIAPAAIFTFTDVDGDAVTVKTSKGTNADLAAVITTSTPAGSVMGGKSLDTINLAMNTVFDGTDISVTAKPGPLGGDGLVNVNNIQAVGLDLGVVKIGGDLANLDAGKNTITSTIKSISVNSTSGANVWLLDASVGAINVARDLRGAEIDLNVVGAKLGVLKIGGSLIGESATKTGFISVPSGTIGSVTIGRDLQGGTSAVGFSGAITAKDILSVKIGGSLLGGTGVESGKILASHALGKVTIKGDVRGGAGMESGRIQSDGTLGFVTIGGSLLGDAGDNSGSIRSGAAGAVKIGRDLRGGSSGFAGSIQSLVGVAAITIGGDLIGGSDTNTGYIPATISIGPVKIGGSILGGTGSTSGVIGSAGKLGDVTIGGSVIADALGTARISANSGIGAVKIGGSLVGSGGNFGNIIAGTSPGSQLAIKSLTVGGRVENTGIYSGQADAQIGTVKVGGDWIASNLTIGINAGADVAFGTADDAASGGGGDPALFSKIASIVIGGQVKGTVGGMDHFGFVSQEIGSLTIHGVKVPLTAGRGNDTDVNNTRFILGTTRDVTVHEVV